MIIAFMHKFFVVLIFLLLPQFRAAAQDQSLFHVESTDRSLNRYWEERLLLNPELYLYANVQPRLVPANEQQQAATGVALDLKRRIDSFSAPANFQLNRLGVFSSKGDKGIRLNTRFVPYLEEMAAGDAKPIHRIGINSEAWVVPSDKVQIHLRLRVENHGELYSQFNGRKWDDKITGWVDNAAVYYHNNGFFGSLGRSSIVWGPEERDALLFSDNAPQFDRIWLGYEHKAVRFDYFITRLDDVKYNDSLLVRYLSAHRLSFRKGSAFEIGLSEVALYGGYNRPVDWRYLNPFTTYYWEQWNRGSDDNIFFGLDFSIYWPHKSRIFGELMIDDFQIDLESEPNQIGYKIGLDMLEPLGFDRLFTKLSYTRVNTTVYGQNQPQNLYLYYDKPIGYFDGNDQDRLLALARYHWSQSFDLELEFQYTRKGEGRIEKHERSGVPFEDKFPTGVVEKSPSIKATALWFANGLFEGRASVKYSHFNNYLHVCGDNVNRTEINLFLAYFLQGLVD